MRLPWKNTSSLARAPRAIVRTAVTGAALALLASGCQATPEAAAPPVPAPVAEASPEEPVATAPEGPNAVAEARAGVGLGAGTAAAAAAKFKAWGVVHAFMGQTVVGGRAVSAREAIAFTKDNHVGVTTDGGASWGFVRHTSGEVRAVAGTAGGPFVAVGKAGYMAISTDGRGWTDLARFTEDELIDVAVSDAGVVAVSRGGVWVAYDKAGRGGAAGILPDKFKASRVVADATGFVALAGKKAYSASNGRSWTLLAVAPLLPDAKKSMTHRGLCSVARVGKANGVSCEVKGLAWGLSPRETLVYDKKNLAFTQDAGDTWAIAPAPFAGIEGVVGNPGGPIFVYGAKGAVATSRDGHAWSEVNVNVTATLRAAYVAGTELIIVGDAGTIVRSTDGGESFSVVPSPVNKPLKQIAKVDGRFVVPIGTAGIESSDGVTWIELVDPNALAAIAPPVKPGKCEGTLPERDAACAVARAVTTPLGLPAVRAIDFAGDAGLAFGDAGLVAFTGDGGATWSANSGFVLRGLASFVTKGKTIVAVGGTSVIVSADGGASFREAQLPKKAGRVYATYVTDGTVFAAGEAGTILKSSGDLSQWELMNTGEKNRTRYIGLHEANGTLYATGQRGELYRAEAGGTVWFQVATGVKDPIQALTGEGTTVLAVTYVDRRGGNQLLRSDDDGQHFYVLHEVSDSGKVNRFTLKDGALLYNERSSQDFGGVWTNAGDDYWAGSVEVGDGSGLRVVNYPSTYVRDRFMVVAAKDDWAIVDAFTTKGAYVTCDGGTGCWMVNGGQVYRPL